MSPAFRFRPHHFLCTVGFQGKGYSDEFVQNYTQIANELRTPGKASLGDSATIEVVRGSDSICMPCPNRRGEKCETEEKISKLDQAHSEILQIKPGDRMTWGEAKKRIRESFTIEKHHEACAPCSWMKSGMCEEALKKLKALVLVAALAFSLISSPSVMAAHRVAQKKTKRTPAEATQKQPSSNSQKKPKKTPASLRALNRSYEAWEKRDTAVTLREAKAAAQDALYADHAHALIALASLYDAEKKLDSKNPKGALSEAQSAAENFAMIRERYLYSPWWAESARGLAQAELALGAAYAKSKDWKSSTREFEKAFQRLSQEGGNYLITASHLETYSERCKKAETPLCKAWVVKFANTYSKNSAESRAIAKSFPDQVDVAKPNFANSKITTGYKQRDSDDLAFEEAFKKIVSEDWGSAIDAFKKFNDDFPRSASRFRVKYWLAHALDKKGHSEDAQRLWTELYQETPLTHYGILASWKISKPLIDRFADVSNSETINEDPFQTPIEAARLSRVRSLIEAKAYGLAAKDLRAFRPRDTASGNYLLYLAEISSTTGAHLTTFTILSDMIQRADESVYTKRVLDFIFPTPDWSLIQKIAKDQELDPILVLSLIKQESAFDREAQSSVGASGYMQLMPFTASDVEPNIERRDLLLPENNVRVGTKYLKKLLAKFNGNIALSLAAYNAGPTTVDRWMKEGKTSQGVLEFIEQIPYKETRDYVGTIFRNYVWYKKRIENLTITDASDFWKNPNSTPNPSIQVVSAASSVRRKPAATRPKLNRTRTARGH